MGPLRSGDPRQIGSCRLLGRLETSGTAEAFLGETPDGRQVTVKLVTGEHVDDVHFRKRFADEVAAAKKVRNFYTAPVVDADPDGDPPWLATSYFPGPSLADAVRQHGPLGPDSAGRIGAAAATGLTAIHSCGLVHRDFTPDSIVLADDAPRIVDLGLARTDGAAGLTPSGGLAGTIAYLPPEQLSGESVDFRSDVFSLGCVIAYAATGRSPFAEDTVPATAARIMSGQPKLDGLDGPLRAVIMDCLAADPGARPRLDAVAARLTGADVPHTDDADWIIADDPEPTTVKVKRLGCGGSIGGLSFVAVVIATGVGIAAHGFFRARA